MMLKELSKEYRKSAELLRQRIAVLGKEEKYGGLCEMELLRLRIRLETLRTMYYDTLRTAKYLEEYYI